MAWRLCDRFALTHHSKQALHLTIALVATVGVLSGFAVARLGIKLPKPPTGG